MPVYRAEGLVLKRTNLGEADRIITFLTPDQGRVKAIAKGVRKIKSRLAGHLELFSDVELMLAKGRNLEVVTGARLRSFHGAIASDWQRLAHAYLMAEILDRLAPENQEAEGVYRMAKEYLVYLEKFGPSEEAELYLKLKLLDELGYRPQLEGCSTCGRSGQETEYFFSPELGGIVDRTCAPGELAPMTTAAIKLWRLMLSRPLGKLTEVAGVRTAACDSLPACDNLIEYIFGHRFKSKQILSA